MNLRRIAAGVLVAAASASLVPLPAQAGVPYEAPQYCFYKIKVWWIQALEPKFTYYTIDGRDYESGQVGRRCIDNQIMMTPDFQPYVQVLYTKTFGV